MDKCKHDLLENVDAQDMTTNHFIMGQLKTTEAFKSLPRSLIRNLKKQLEIDRDQKIHDKLK